MTPRQQALLGTLVAILVLNALVPGSAHAAVVENCCMELAASNTVAYTMDYLQNGDAYDGSYSFSQRWDARGILSFQRTTHGEQTLLLVGDGYSTISLAEGSSVTVCTSATPEPCFEREPLACSLMTEEAPGEFSRAESSGYAPGMTFEYQGWLKISPGFGTYFAVERAGCTTDAPYHYGYSDGGAFVPSDPYTVQLDRPRPRFLISATPGNSCTMSASGRNLIAPEDHGYDRAPYGWDASIDAAYSLKWFPADQLEARMAELSSLDENPDAFAAWGMPPTAKPCRVRRTG
jgi:hypothetical protein